MWRLSAYSTRGIKLMLPPSCSQTDLEHVPSVKALQRYGHEMVSHTEAD